MRSDIEEYRARILEANAPKVLEIPKLRAAEIKAPTPSLPPSSDISRVGSPVWWLMWG